MYKNIIKWFLTPFVFIMLSLGSCEKMAPYHDDGSEVTAAEAMEIVRPIIQKYAEEGRFWSISKNPIPGKTTLNYGPLGIFDPTSDQCGTFKSPSFRAWLIMISPDGMINGSSYEALCLFVNILTGEYVEINIDGEVSGIEWDHSFHVITEDSPSSDDSVSSVGQKRSRRLLSSTSGLYAVIISGGIDLDRNFSRYWNDCQYVYQRLTQTLGYDKSHIYCLVADGTNPAVDMFYDYDSLHNIKYYKSSPLDFDNDGDNDIQYSATKTNISTVFNLLQAQSSSIEYLLVFVTDHGTPSGICLWGENQIMTPAELDVELDKLSNVKMDIVMGQCNSGIFTSLCEKNRTVSTACSATEPSYPQGPFSYDYFLRSWTDAFDPTNASTVDTNSDNMISLREAFSFAESNDPKAITGDEHPQYSSFPLIYGYTHDLLGADNCPVLSGSNYLSCNYSSIYTISGLPTSTSVTWNSSGDINLTSPTNTSVAAKGVLPSTSYVSNLGYIMALFTLEGTQYSLTKEIPSIWKPGYYYGYNHIFGGGGQYAVETGEGASGYQWGSDNSAWVILSPNGSPQVTVSEGQTWSPVTLWVTFLDPWGTTIVTGQQFNTTY